MTFVLVAATGLVVVGLDRLVRRRVTKAPRALMLLYVVLAAWFHFLTFEPSAPGLAADGPVPSMLAGGFTAMALSTGWGLARGRRDRQDARHGAVGR